MSQTQIGQKSFEERLQEYEKIIDGYIKGLGLNISLNPEVEKYLGLTDSQLKSICPEDCAIGCFILEQYAAYLLQERNAHVVKTNWCNQKLDYIIAQQYNNYAKDKFTKYEVVKNQIIKNDSSAQQLMRMLLSFDGICKRIDGIHLLISNLAKRLDGIKYVKMQRKD